MFTTSIMGEGKVVEGENVEHVFCFITPTK
jgi:hypothetical protein